MKILYTCNSKAVDASTLRTSAIVSSVRAAPVLFEAERKRTTVKNPVYSNVQRNANVIISLLRKRVFFEGRDEP